MRTRLIAWIPVTPRASPTNRARQVAGKATTAAKKMRIVSTPLQPFRILTAKRAPRITVPS